MTGNEKILIIEDNRQLIDLLKDDILEPLGYCVSSAIDGVTGLRRAVSDQPDLILLDLNLPRMSGMEILQALSKESTPPPAILMTVHGSEKIAVDAFRLGVVDYIVKPFPMQELLDSVERALRKSRLVSERDSLLAQLSQANEQLQRQLRDQSQIQAIGRALTASLDQPSVLQGVVQAATQVTEADTAVLLLLDPSGQNLHLAASTGLPPEEEQRFRVRIISSPVGDVIRTGEPLIQMSPPQSAGLKVTTNYLARAILFVPLQLQQRPLGVLGAMRTQSQQTFEDSHVGVLSALADYAAIAIENARLFVQIRTWAGRQARLSQVIQEVSSSLEKERILETAIHGIERLLEPELAHIWLWEPASRELKLQASGGKRTSGPQITLAPDEGAPSWVARSGKLVSLLEPPLPADAIHHLARLAPGIQPASLLCVPIRVHEGSLGALELVSSVRGRFQKHDITLIRSVAAALGVALENAHLYGQQQEFARQLQASQAQLVRSEKMAALGRLAASLAHELNNPLQALQNHLFLLSSLDEDIDTIQADERRQHVAVIQEEISRLGQLTHQMLATSSRETSQQTPRPTDLHETLNDMQMLVGKRLQQANTRLELRLAPSLPPVMAVTSSLQQVMLNLIINAIEAMPEGGTLTIESGYDTRAGEVWLSFQDTGVGISADALSDIFDPFYTTKVKGSGLGLWISSEIVESLGGRIEVESQPGKGSRFTLYLLPSDSSSPQP
jgi:two-component system NtrC family sensor kinase